MTLNEIKGFEKYNHKNSFAIQFYKCGCKNNNILYHEKQSGSLWHNEEQKSTCTAIIKHVCSASQCIGLYSYWPARGKHIFF